MHQRPALNKKKARRPGHNLIRSYTSDPTPPQRSSSFFWSWTTSSRGPRGHAMHAPLVRIRMAWPSIQGASSPTLESGPTSAREVLYLLPGAGRARQAQALSRATPPPRGRGGSKEIFSGANVAA
jgi:hypothetical protein